MFILQIFKQARVKACTKVVLVFNLRRHSSQHGLFWPSIIKDNHLLCRGRDVASAILLSHVSLFRAITDVNGL